MSKEQNREVAIRLSGVKKMYKLGQIGGGTLHGDLESWWARIRGKEDPNTLIGTDQRLVGKTFMALNGIDLTVYKGEALGIIGGNGAGKSTMLKLLSRVTAPTEGEIDIYGRIASMLEVGTGFHGEMTGRENVYLNGAILGMSKAEIDAKMEDIIEFSEVRDFIDTPVKRYSSGMYVKLAFSVAAHLDSEIMIMDEVLAVGDMAFQKKCLDKMRDAAKKEGRTVLYVSHNMNTIRQLCDRCIVLDKGKLIFNGEVENAIDQYLGLAQEAQTYYEYLDSFHSDGRTCKQFRMNWLKIYDVDEPVFSTGDKIKLGINYSAKESFGEIYLRFELQTYAGDAIATAVTNSAFKVDEQGGKEIKMILSLDHIVSGQYRINIVAYQANEFGAENFLDGVYPGLVFRIDDDANESGRGLVWLPQYWGHIKLDDVEIVD